MKSSGKASKQNPMGGVGFTGTMKNIVSDNAGKAGSYSIRGGSKK